ncbi:hypothetical protein DDR33_13800, partial [Pararcticibacter amylolyticus]
PNREVKPARADGTAVTRGRVGRCQPLQEPVSDKLTGFFCIMPETQGMAGQEKRTGDGTGIIRRASVGGSSWIFTQQNFTFFLVWRS